ncbi:hypothetical protein D3C75_1257700 [compost metagenome]
MELELLDVHANSDRCLTELTQSGSLTLFSCLNGTLKIACIYWSVELGFCDN